jgi:hypothetical protein
MSTEGWIFMIGFRVLDVGLLVLWLVWFFRLRDDDDSDGGGGPGGGGGPRPEPTDGPGGGGLALPLGRVRAGGRRIRDHAKPHSRPPRRGTEQLPSPSPPRIRRPVTPSPVHRRTA